MFNKGAQFDGCSLTALVQIDGAKKIADFCNEIVRKLGVDARTVILNIVPILLRCSVRVYIMGAEVCWRS